MQKVKIVKQWRGHDPGTEPELTDERAAELIRGGYAEPWSKPVAVVEEPVVVEPVEEVEEHPRPRSRRRSQ